MPSLASARSSTWRDKGGLRRSMILYALRDRWPIGRSPHAFETSKRGPARIPRTGRRELDSPLRSRENILETLEAFPGELERVVFSNDVTEEDILRPGSDGGWGITEILPHLRDWEAIFFERARQFVEEDHPHIVGYDDSLWPIERDYRGQDPVEVFEEFRQLREEHVDLLRGLPAEGWSRTGQHSLYGDITLQWMENHVCDHDHEHLTQIRDVLVS
jgi:hypothetical protein